MNNSVKGILLLLLAAFLYGIMPVLIRILGLQGIPPTSQVFLRYIAAFLSAFLYFFLFARTKIAVKKRDIAPFLLVTVFGYALANLFFTYGILYTQVSNALFLYYTFAIIAPILGFVFLRDRLNIFNVVGLLVIMFALMLLFQPNSFPTWKIGGFFAILSALAHASYIILRRRLKKYSASFMMLANTFMGVIALGFLSFFLEGSFYGKGISSVSPQAWIMVVLFGVDNFFAYFAVTKGFEYFKVATGSIVLLAELVFGIFFAFLFFHEIPTIAVLIGGVLIVIASVMVIFKGEN